MVADKYGEMCGHVTYILMGIKYSVSFAANAICFLRIACMRHERGKPYKKGNKNRVAPHYTGLIFRQVFYIVF